MVDSVSDTAVSGAILRDLLTKAVVTDVVHRVRRDPTESADDDQRLTDALEVGLATLEAHSQCELRAELFGQSVAIPLARSQVIEVARPLIDRMRNTLTDWSRRFASQQTIDYVLYWGDLASKLATRDLISHVFTRSETIGLDQCCIARGVARLVSMVRGGSIDVGGVRQQESFPVLATLPVVENLGQESAVIGARIIELDVHNGASHNGERGRCNSVEIRPPIA